ncbi:MAG: hypothetical protein WAN48_15515 [Actinomycetes bacterium]
MTTQPTRRTPVTTVVVGVLVALLAQVLPLLVLEPAHATVPVPVTPALGKAIEDFAPYQGGVKCDLVDRPGAKKIASLIRATYGADESIGISYNACYTVSEHNEGRALDWMIDTTNRADMAKAKAFLGWLLGPDKYGNKAAMARRLGVMYIIFNRRMWRAYSPRGWGDYTGTNPHTDHMHISLSLDGSTGRTSFWTDQPLAGPCQPSTLATSAPPLPTEPSTFVPVPATRVLSTVRGLGTVNGPCRLFAPIEYTSTPTRVDALVTGVGSVPATGVSSVALQVTMANPSFASALTAGPAGGAIADAARVSAGMNETSTSLVVVPVGADGKVSFFTSYGATDLVVNVVGYYPDPTLVPAARDLASGDLLRMVRPRPLLDGASSPVGAGARTRIQVADTRGVSPAATAAVVTLNVPASAGSGRLFVYPTGSQRPKSPVLSYTKGTLSTVQTVVPLGSGGSITVENAGRTAKAVDVDVSAAYQPATLRGGVGFVARHKVVTVVNTAKNLGIRKLNSGDTKVISLAKRVPVDAKAVLLEVTIRKPSADTRLTFWRADGRRPHTVDAAAASRQSVSTTVLAQLSANREVKLRNVGADGVNLVVSVVGTYR